MTQWEYTKGLHKLAKGTYAYLQPPGTLGGSNAGLITAGDESLLIDTLYDLERTREMIRSFDAIPGAVPLNYLVNTHVDGDHTYGNQLFEDIDIIASQTCAQEFARDIKPKDYVELLKNAPAMGKTGQYLQMALGDLKLEDVRLTPPNRTFEGRLDLNMGNREVNLIEVGPAHTEGDVIVYIPDEKVVFTGDLVFSNITPPSWHGPATSIIKAIETILVLDFEILVPGHGAISDRSAALRMKEYWEYTSDAAKELFDKGVPALDAGIELSKSGKFADLPLSLVNIINCHMLYREFSCDDTPLDKFSIMGEMADLLIP